ncbi:MAG: hypothetical protein ACOC1F_08275, partial [Myxococcota bacterium]
PRADLEHCGGCNIPCAPGQYCVHGQCQGHCPSPYETCQVNGQTQCVTTNTALHCTSCNNRCMLGAVCLFLACVCQPPTIECDGACTDTQSDPLHCGACDVVCQPGLGCVDGLCECYPDQTRCGTACVDTDTSPEHCGGCGQGCDLPNASETCTAGVCTLTSCETGAMDCDGDPSNGCERLDTVENCGSCGNDCLLPNTIVECDAGQCAIVDCETGYADCDGDMSNGCESLTTLENCGACGQPCTTPHATPACNAGVCEIVACEQDHDDCDGDVATGCETLLTTLTDCGSCGQVCDFANANETCATGTCEMTSCEAGYVDCGSGSGCETLPVWYRDEDQDNWGTDVDTQAGCSQPAGYVAQGGDCDEGNPAVHPGASFHTTPLPDGSYDYDCDGVESYQYPDVFSCSLSGSGCTSNEGWLGSVRDCGQGGSQSYCKSCATVSINGNKYCECGWREAQTQGCR